MVSEIITKDGGLNVSIIKSLLDNDTYKFFMQNAILNTKNLCGNKAQYDFINRRKEKQFVEPFIKRLKEEIGYMQDLKLTSEEREFLEKQNIFNEKYLDYLSNYEFNPKQVKISLSDNELNLTVNGKWEETVLWEVPLMALISEIYFQEIDTEWDYEGQEDKIKQKIFLLDELKGSYYSDFGTRRRRSFESQRIVVENLAKHASNCVGTSNVYLAMKNNMKPIGTVAHEWYMGISAIHGFSSANFYGLKYWSDIYRGKLGIALTDTFTTKCFLNDFDEYWARLYDGLRQDSGKPLEWFEKVIKHYENLNLPYQTTKTLVFSDGLDIQKVTEIYKAVQEYNIISNKLKFIPYFGIGTNLTNDFDNSLPLNMVIKLAKLKNNFTVKVSDVLTKCSGNEDRLKEAFNIFKVLES